jgi:hypothetical protein
MDAHQHGEKEEDKMNKKNEAAAYKKILELVPSEAEADVPGEFYQIKELKPGVWQAEYRIPLVKFGQNGMQSIYECYVLSVTEAGIANLVEKKQIPRL